MTRITSYNVCYTKLLRIAAALGDADLIARTEALIAREEAALETKLAPYRTVFAGKKAVLNTGVITSYSIHYTKLYDGDYPDVDYAFSSIRLTDPQSKVVQILGPRYVERKVDAIGGVMWDYHPFDITIECVGGKVYSRNNFVSHTLYEVIRRRENRLVSY